MSSFSGPYSQTNAAPIETGQLEELRARLIDAQAAEIAASNALIDFNTAQSHDDGASFSSLMADARLARDRTTAAYEEWSRAVAAFNNSPAGISEPVFVEDPAELPEPSDASTWSR